MSKGTRRKTWFLTFPQCPATKSDIIENLEAKVGTIDEYIIGYEQHEDGTPHVHAYIKFDQPQTPGVKMDRFDIKVEDVVYHGNYQAPRNVKTVAHYCIKGGKYESNIDVDAWFNKQSKVLLTVDEVLNKSFEELMDEGRITYKNVPTLYRARRKILERRRKKRFKEMNAIILPKKRHYWHYGNTNTGKTTKLTDLIDNEWKDNECSIPTNNDWCFYDNQKYLWIDNYYDGDLEINELNRICDGNCQVNIKGGGLTKISRSCEVHVFSNFNIRDCYSNCEEDALASLYNRFTEIEYKKLN